MCEAQPDIPDNRDMTPLLAACYRNRIEVLRCLLGNSQVLASINAARPNGSTPLLLASSLGHAEVASLLVEEGAYVHAVAAEGYTPTNAAPGPLFYWTKGCTPLHAAVAANHAAVVKVLLAAGADPLATTTFQATCLHLAAQLGSMAALKELLEVVPGAPGGGGVDTLALGKTALHLAAEFGQADCVEVLLAAGADANKLCAVPSTSAGATALHLAVKSGCPATALLLTTPSNMGAVWNGKTPHELVVSENKFEAGVALATAMSSTGAFDQKWGTLMDWSACSASQSIRALLPAIVRKYCSAHPQQPGPGHAPPASGLAAVARAVSTPLPGGPSTRVIADCLIVVMEVWGLAAARTVLQQMLERSRGRISKPTLPWMYSRGSVSSTSNLVTDSSWSGCEVIDVMYYGWSEQLQPLLQKRAQVMDRLQALVTQPLLLQQQARGSGGKAAGGGQQAAAGASQAGGSGSTRLQLLKAEATTAAEAGQWQVYVNCLEGLAASDPAAAGQFVRGVGGTHAQAVCKALLSGWWEARQQGPARVTRALVEAVVAAAQAWKQQRKETSCSQKVVQQAGG